MLRRSVFLIGLFVAIAVVGGSAAVHAQAASSSRGLSRPDHSNASFAHRILYYGQCCNGERLYGTKASIVTPPFPDALYFPTPNCIGARSDAEGPSQLIQTGWVRCKPPATLDGTCSLYDNLIKFVETLSPDSDILRCYPKGDIGYGAEVLYSVRYEWFDTWYAWIGGVQDTHPISMPDADLILEGMEWTEPGCQNFHGQAEYALAIPWQRFQASYTWYQVQSSAKHLDCGWTDWGGPPYNFSFFH